MKILKHLTKANTAGDTIVEVMISMTVLALVLATAYTTSTRSLQVGLDSQDRSQAVNYAQSQIEVIKNLDGNGLLDDSYKTGPFCFLPPNLTYQAIPPSGNNPCANVNNSIYTITDKLDGTPAQCASHNSAYTCAFIITVQWPTSNGHSDQSILKYKPFGSFVSTPSGVCQIICQ